MDAQQTSTNDPAGLYSPLSESNKEIRLIEIFSSSPDGTWDAVWGSKTSCRLYTVSLEQAPSYVAFSYVWGDAAMTEDILVNGQILSVTVNLASALKNAKRHWKAMGHDPENLRVWADAICINQQDLEERSSQVQLMRQIYDSAEMTFAWISRSDQDISQALDLLNTIYDLATRHSKQPLPDIEYSVYWPIDVSYFSERVDWDSFITALLDMHPLNCAPDPKSKDGISATEPWASLQRMFSLPYWNRVWIHQEAILSKKFYFMCPSQMIESSRANMALDGVTQMLNRPLPGQGMHDAVRAMFQTVLTRAKGPSLKFLKSRALGYGPQKPPYQDSTRLALLSSVFLVQRMSTDPRDQVYGVLGYVGLDIVPDYRASVGGVYLDFARKFIDEMEGDKVFFDGLKGKLSLSFLSECAAGIGNGLDLPSWAPSFQLSRLDCLRCFRLSDKAYLRLPGTQRAFATDRSLWTPVVRVAPVTKRRAAGVHYTPCEETVKLFDEILASYGPTYVNGTTITEALCRVLMMKPTGDIDLCGLAIFFHLRCGWKSPPGLLYDQIKDSLARNSHVPDPSDKAAVRHMLDAIVGRFLNKWTFKHTDGFKTFQLIETLGGFLGLAGEDAREDDVVCMVKGCGTPVLLRHEGDHFRFVGPCSVLGLMGDDFTHLLKAGAFKVEFIEMR